jgi:hypothetical protein
VPLHRWRQILKEAYVEEEQVQFSNIIILFRTFHIYFICKQLGSNWRPHNCRIASPKCVTTAYIYNGWFLSVQR